MRYTLHNVRSALAPLDVKIEKVGTKYEVWRTSDNVAICDTLTEAYSIGFWEMAERCEYWCDYGHTNNLAGMILV